MKILKKNKMFLLFSNINFYIGGSLGVRFQKKFPLMHFLSLNKTFFLLKQDLKLFQKLIMVSQNVLQFGCFLEILITGVGFKCWLYNKNNLILDLGYSHFIKYKNKGNLFFRVTRYSICCFGISLYEVGLVVSELISLRPTDAYKGKGLRLVNSPIFLKIGKQR